MTNAVPSKIPSKSAHLWSENARKGDGEIAAEKSYSNPHRRIAQ
jgi:hypothetical protein